LSNLDTKLREETRKELHTFLARLKITAVYVTHDRIEALSISDRIAVMRAGRIVEEGDPKKIYFRSDSRFVADFIGRANLIPGKVASVNGEQAVLDSEIGIIVAQNPQKIPAGGKALACVRPEFLLVNGNGGGNTFRGKVETLLFIGETYEGEIRIDRTLLTALIPPTADAAEGSEISVSFNPDHCFLLPE